MKIDMLNCEEPRYWRKGTHWEVRILHLDTLRSLWELYQINNESKVTEAQDVQQKH